MKRPDPEYGLFERTTITMHPLTLARNFDFPGCTSADPEFCACETWEEALCRDCGEEITDGQWIYSSTRETVWDPRSWSDCETESTFWHLVCPTPQRDEVGEETAVG